MPACSSGPNSASSALQTGDDKQAAADASEAEPVVLDASSLDVGPTDAGIALDATSGHSEPMLDDLEVSGIQIPLKPSFDPLRLRYSALASDPTQPLVITATAAGELSIDIAGESALSGEPLSLVDAAPGSEIEIEVRNGHGETRVYELVYLPAHFPDMRITAHESNASTHPIYVTPSRGGARFIAKLDNAGVPSFYREQSQRIFDFKKHPGGLMSYALDPATVVGATHIILNSNFEEIDRVRTTGLKNTDEHDFHILPNGNYLLLAYERTLHDLTPYGGLTTRAVRDGVVQELSPELEVLFEWNTWGVLPYDQSLYSTDDYAHINSVVVDHDGNLLVSSRGFSQVLKLDRETGEVIWRLGGTSGDFTFINDPFAHLCGQHTVSRLDNGHILAFDNGQYCSPPVAERGELTRIVEYALDEEAMTAELVWSYSREGAYTFSQGSVQRLDNGNTFIGWGQGAPMMATEVDPEGNIVFEMVAYSSTGPVVSYRAWRFQD